MLFNSLSFIIFLTLTFLLYTLFFGKEIKRRNWFLLAVSYIFYGSWNWKLLFLIVFVSAVNYFCGKAIHRAEEQKKRKLWLVLCLAVNLGVLAFFKYCNFFIGSFADLLGLFGANVSLTPLNIILPVGISFYIFQGLSYSLDIYYRRFEPDDDIVAFFAFIAFFPQLVAGPIERAKDLLPQFHELKGFDYDRTREGLFAIVAGLFKKMVIADRLAVYVDGVYGNPAAAAGLPSLVAVLFFTFQLYLDFSAYSQIAVGTAKLFGFNLHRNFNRPYLAVTFKDFWGRWHMTLMSWFRDYLYIPLGGNRRGKARTMLNLFIVFLVSGLWHGASWTFVAWGALNGIFLIVFDKLLGLNPKNTLGKVFSCFLVVGLWALSLIFFRAESFPQAMTMFSNLGFGGADSLFSFGLPKAEFFFAVLLLAGLIIIELLTKNREEQVVARFFGGSPVLRWAVYLLLVLAILYLGIYGNGSDNAFIYFQF